ncbi:hypothetical protein Voja6_00224 [Pseudomonas phage vB_PpuM-Voja-6]
MKFPTTNDVVEMLTNSEWYVMTIGWILVFVIAMQFSWILWNVVLRFLKCYARGFSFGLMTTYVAIRSGAPIQYVLFYLLVETILLAPFHFIREEMFSGVHYSSMTLANGGTWSGTFQWYIRKEITRKSWNQWEAEMLEEKAKRAEIAKRNREDYLRDPDNFDV